MKLVYICDVFDDIATYSDKMFNMDYVLAVPIIVVCIGCMIYINYKASWYKFYCKARKKNTFPINGQRIQKRP